MGRIRIVLVDDNPGFLQVLTSLLAGEFEIVATAADGTSALEVIRERKPELIVLDLGIPGLNGIEVTREIVKSPESDPPVVICSVETDLQVVEAARQAGAMAYVFKIRVERDLILAVKSALLGKPFVSPRPA